MNTIIISGEVDKDAVIESSFDDAGNEIRKASYDIKVPRRDGIDVMHVETGTSRAADWAEANAKAGASVILAGSRRNDRENHRNYILVGFDGHQIVGTGEGLNVCVLRGNLTADPRKADRSVGNDTIAIANFAVAVNRPNRGGVDYFYVTAFRKSAEFVAKYFKKGSPIEVKGRVVDASYVDKDGNKHTADTLQADTVEFGGKKE